MPELDSIGGGAVFSNATIKGFTFACIGTYLFSLGNMISKRHSLKGLKPITSNAYGICYGTAILMGVLFVTAEPLVVGLRPQYLGALFYLSIFGTIIGFTTYLTLVARFGANKAAYATVIFPVVALILSSWFEGYHWQVSSAIGLGLTILGDFIINFGALKTMRFTKVKC